VQYFGNKYILTCLIHLYLTNLPQCGLDDEVIKHQMAQKDNLLFYPFADETQTALFKDPVRTAL
jgi:hypothetical protein